MSRVFLSLGSNVGKREENITKAISYISLIHGCQVVTISPLYETKPVGGTQQRDFLNQVIEIITDLSPQDLLYEMQWIEKSLGRIRNGRFGPRTIDIDILLFDNVVVHEDNLNIPHPRMHERLFVLVPLADIAADVIHPILQQKIGDMRDEMREKVGEIQKIAIKS